MAIRLCSPSLLPYPAFHLGEVTLMGLYSWLPGPLVPLGSSRGKSWEEIRGREDGALGHWSSSAFCWAEFDSRGFLSGGHKFSCVIQTTLPPACPKAWLWDCLPAVTSPRRFSLPGVLPWSSRGFGNVFIQLVPYIFPARTLTDSPLLLE